MKAKPEEPYEEQYGRDNYLFEANSYGTTDDQWILALSAAFIENKDIDTGDKLAHHDLLTAYVDNDYGSSINEFILFTDLTLETTEEIEERIENIFGTWPTDTECDIFDATNTQSLKAIQKIAKSDYENNKDMASRLIYLWENKNTYAEGFSYRIAYIAESMWQIRLATLKGIISENKAWIYLRKLATLIRPLMTQFSSWDEYLDNIHHFYHLDQFSYKTSRKDFKKAIVCLKKSPLSPLHEIDYHFGIDRNNPYNLQYNDYYLTKHYRAKKDRTFNKLVFFLQQEDIQSLWAMLDRFDEDKKQFYLLLIINALFDLGLYEEDMMELPLQYPDTHYSYLFRGQYLALTSANTYWDASSRSYYDDNSLVFTEYYNDALTDFKKAQALNPDNPVIWLSLLDALSHSEHNEENTNTSSSIINLIEKKALSNLACTTQVIKNLYNYEDDSQEKIEAWVKRVMQGTKKGDLSRLAPFIALERNYYTLWINHDDDDENAEDPANKMINDIVLTKTLSEPFDELLETMQHSQYAEAIASYLVFWCIERKDIERLRQIGHKMRRGQYHKNPLDNYYSDRKILWLMNWIRMI